MGEIAYDRFYETTGICTDTRAITPGCLFVCVKGEKFDGNTFAAEAIRLGAKYVIVDDQSQLTDANRMSYVEDSLKYIQQLANLHRKKFDIPVIGITGSNGKTTTKELMHAVLAKKYNVLATRGNLNNHLGVPLTLLRLTAAHEIAIIEMGANRFKDIEELCAIAEPNYGIITNIGKAHLEGFGDFDGVLRTKRELYEAIGAVNGTIVFNSDDSILFNELPATVQTIDYGTTLDSMVFGSLLNLTPFIEMSWETANYKSADLTTKMIGKYNFYNYLAAVAFGMIFKVDNESISQAITEYTPTNNRSQVEETDSNMLIVDCYNANPTSMRSALESFAMISHPAKLFIIGDMKELGADTEREHREIIELVESLDLSGYTVGTVFGAIQSSRILQSFEITADLTEYLEINSLSDKLILLKGSRSIELEKALPFL